MTELDVQSGWSGKDRDGGTWVRLGPTALAPWLSVDATGLIFWCTQEQAEAADLIAVVAETYVDEWRAKYEEYFREFCKAADEVDELVGKLDAQLDLDSPEDHERVGAFIQEFNRRRDLKAWTPIQASDMYKGAETLRRDAAEAEQNAKDQNRAKEIARDLRPFGNATPEHVALVLAGIHDERERQEEK